MSYAVCHFEKFGKGVLKGLEIHNQRTKDGTSHSSSDIDWDRTHLNYDLHNTDHINYHKAVGDRIKQLNFKKAVRKDAVLLGGFVVTSDKAFFDGLTDEQTMSFFMDSYKFLKDRYGSENVVSAMVHLDETKPHMHLYVVPVTQDGRLSAKSIFNRNELMKFHTDFHECVGFKYGLDRGETREEKRKHLSTAEFKLQADQDALKSQMSELYLIKQKIDKDEKKLEERKRSLDREERILSEKEDSVYNAYKAASRVLNKLGYFNTIDHKKSLLGGKITLTETDYKKIIAMAKMATYLTGIKSKYDKLVKENEKIRKAVEVSVKEQLQTHKEINRLKDECNNLAHNYDEVIGYLTDRELNDDFEKYRDEQELIRQKEIE